MSVTNISNLHKWHHDDYDEAKAQIHQALGSTLDIEIFGRQVLVAVYIRPNITPGGFCMTVKAQQEDVWQGKAVLIVKCGPDAFAGDEGYVRGMFGQMPHPGPGDWVFLRASDGLPINLCGDDASRPKGRDHRGDPIDLFEWDGWPCRVITDEAIVGRINKPHTLV